MSQDLDTVIPVDDPLEPAKGGFLKAYKDNYQPAFGSNSRTANSLTGKLDPLPYNMGLKDEMPKISLNSGKLFNLRQSDVCTHYFDLNYEPRIIDLNTVKQLGLELHQDESTIQAQVAHAITQVNSQDLFPVVDYDGHIEQRHLPTIGRLNYISVVKHCNLAQSSLFQATISEGLLVSLSAIKDKDFIQALDKAAQAVAPKLSFDDDKYAPQFHKLENYFNQLQLKVYHTSVKDFDELQDLYAISNQGEAFTRRNQGEPLLEASFKQPWLDLPKYPFINFSSVIEENIFLPPPSNFKSENDYLKAGAHAITNTLIDFGIDDFAYNNQLQLSEQDYLLLKPRNIVSMPTTDNNQSLDRAFLTRDIAGTMFAAQLGVPITQNEINRFNAYFKDKKFPELEVMQLFDTAAHIAKFAANHDLSKIGNILCDEYFASMPEAHKNQDLWGQWKADNERYAIQMATPTLREVAKSFEKDLTQDNVLEALNSFVTSKTMELAPHQEQLKEVLKSEPSISKSLLNNFSNLHSKAHDSIALNERSVS